MSKYTTEVRYICETLAGLAESADASQVEGVIAKAIPKIFDFDFPIFDENYRNVIETKILRHYYTREIGLETYGLWKLKLCTKLNEIMPFYNQLYKSELIDFNPLYDVDLTRTSVKRGEGTTDTEVNEDKNTENNVKSDRKTDSTTNANQNQNTSGNKTNMYSDTPQGEITDLQDGKYLTNATIDRNSGTFSGANNETLNGTENLTTDTSSNTTTENKTSSNTTNTEDYLEKVSGVNGGKTYSERLIEYRKTFLNIDMLVINELSDLFMNLW